MGKGDEQVLHDLVKFFDCGKVYPLPSQSSRFQIENVNDLLQKVCPFFETNSLITTKQEHFITSVEAWKLLANHSLTDDVLTEKSTIFHFQYLMGRRSSQILGDS